MIINKIYPNATVKQVIFQITYPNLFYLENRIGDIQQRIMKDFPVSKLLLKRGFIIANNVDAEQKIEIPSDLQDKNITRKIWQFESKNKIVLSIASNSLDLVSEFHKTYELGDDNSKKFKCAIKRAVDAFIDVTKLPIINRIGLRYIDQCPIPAKNNEIFNTWYKTKFPLDKFDIADAEAMTFRTIIKKGDYNLSYTESLEKNDKNEDILILDFDGFARNVENVSNYMDITDDLHKLISAAYTETIEEPVYDWMERTQEEK
jgi:uncharacterized protein (TIGR04255 family)